MDKRSTGKVVVMQSLRGGKKMVLVTGDTTKWYEEALFVVRKTSLKTDILMEGMEGIEEAEQMVADWLTESGRAAGRLREGEVADAWMAEGEAADAWLREAKTGRLSVQRLRVAAFGWVKAHPAAAIAQTAIALLSVGGCAVLTGYLLHLLIG